MKGKTIRISYAANGKNTEKNWVKCPTHRLRGAREIKEIKKTKEHKTQKTFLAAQHAPHCILKTKTEYQLPGYRLTDTTPRCRLFAAKQDQYVKIMTIFRDGCAKFV